MAVNSIVILLTNLAERKGVMGLQKAKSRTSAGWPGQFALVFQMLKRMRIAGTWNRSRFVSAVNINQSLNPANWRKSNQAPD